MTIVFHAHPGGMVETQPNLESLGYSRASLRDWGRPHLSVNRREDPLFTKFPLQAMLIADDASNQAVVVGVGVCAQPLAQAIVPSSSSLIPAPAPSPSPLHRPLVKWHIRAAMQ